jgi:hypothetical protein
MKKLLILSLVLLSFCVCASASAETVAKMTCIIKMPDVIREGLYTGEVQNGVPHGYGVFVTENSSGVQWHYLGEWVNGEMCGQGGEYWDIGQAYVGTFAANTMVYGEMYTNAKDHVYIDYRPDDQGRLHAKEYREDGTLRFDGYVDAKTGNYMEGTFYTSDGKVFFSGVIGEGFNVNQLYIN